MTMEEKLEAQNRKIQYLENRRLELENQVSVEQEKNVVEQNKRARLMTELSDKVECPVCKELPQTPPNWFCSNGHMVCTTCRPGIGRGPCPTCRGAISASSHRGSLKTRTSKMYDPH